ncbi:MULTISPECIES: substrate-binding domain-containing protein [Microbacterium]|uniref:substrate-binding domain-containing protein n=1 Tax=Microbacterium TaxID=33882 RepID=UPI001D175265|nr:substrate-binding domain-containing protein [Microbacterium testaceum]MCC4249645.1 substrate-binding domain-containing protein [Microbacterium testaceum]
MTPCRPARLAFAILVVAAMALTGCAPGTARTIRTSDGAGVIGVSLPASADLAWTRLGDAVGEQLRARGYRVDLQFAADDARTQGAQVQNMLTKGEDAVVLVPVAGEALERAREAAAASAVPLIPAGRDVGGAGVVMAADPAVVGRAQAEALLEALDVETALTPPTIAVVAGPADDPESAARHEAALEVLAPAAASGSVRIVSGADLASAAVTGGAGEVESAAEDRIRTLLGGSEDEPPTAMLALDDAVSRGAVTAVTTPDPRATASPSPTASPDPATEPSARVPPVLVASGGDTTTVRALRDGAVAATVFVDTRSWAGSIADAVAAALAGDTPVPSLAPTPTTVDRDAVQAVFLETGWLRAEDL